MSTARSIPPVHPEQTHSETRYLKAVGDPHEVVRDREA
jgi:hypothetical protein